MSRTTISKTFSKRKEGILEWTELKNLLKTKQNKDYVNGNTNPFARARLFNKIDDVRVIFYRDNHVWCPYCQKVWLFLEEKKIPFKVEKVSMFCYGKKESWYKKKVPRGMLPAVELDNEMITESDVILQELENTFGVLYKSMHDPNVMQLRNLERYLFRAWCSWLCYPSRSSTEENRNKENFVKVVRIVDEVLGRENGPFFLNEFSIVDCIFIPYVERMNASLYYYKGFTLRDETRFPNLYKWFNGIESRSTYTGTQSDFHTHVHDLPPQMGGCYENNTEKQQKAKTHVDNGPWFDLTDAMYSEKELDEDPKQVALERMLLFRTNIINANPLKDKFDLPLRQAMTYMLTNDKCQDTSHSLDHDQVAQSLRYLRDRINVPRDMNIYAARYARTALEDIAKLYSDKQGYPEIPIQDRWDQDPIKFHGKKRKPEWQ
jgi:glutathione S-transferase